MKGVDSIKDLLVLMNQQQQVKTKQQKISVK
jgi:hypothetical protein